MDLAALNRTISLRSLVQTAHPELPAAYVLCGKLIACAWLITGHAAVMPERWLCAVSVLASFIMLVTPWFRLGCGALALSIALGTSVDPGYFANNRLFCAALLCALAISDRGRLWLPRLQVALLYFGAGIDKLLDADWRSGQFLGSFISELARYGDLWSPAWKVGAGNPLASWAAFVMRLSPQLATATSWVVISIELTLALGFVFNASAAYSGSLLLHSAIFALTGSSFGMFFYAGIAASLLVAPRLGPTLGYFALLTLLAGPWVRPWFAWLLTAAIVVGALGRTVDRSPASSRQVAREG